MYDFLQAYDQIKNSGRYSISSFLRLHKIGISFALLGVSLILGPNLVFTRKPDYNYGFKFGVLTTERWSTAYRFLVRIIIWHR
jgi:hypothetical protein